MLPVVEGIGFAAEYVPTGDDAEVGGDFYDVVPLPDGRWLVVIGDVSGKGTGAALLMTVIGPGGVGEASVAVAGGHHGVERWPEAAVLVDLVPARTTGCGPRPGRSCTSSWARGIAGSTRLQFGPTTMAGAGVSSLR